MGWIEALVYFIRITRARVKERKQSKNPNLLLSLMVKTLWIYIR